MPNLKTLLLYGAIIALLVLLFISKCSNSKQAIQNTDQAVSQNRIETPESNVAILEKQNLTYRQSQDSLILINTSLNKQIIQKDNKLAQIALNSVKVKDSIRNLPDDSAVGLFLDRADCSEFPVLKRDTGYIAPIEAIRFYNDLAVDFDALRATNQALVDQNNIRMLQVKNLNKIIESKSKENDNLSKINNDKDGVIVEKDKQIVSVKKQLKTEKRKKYWVGGAAIALYLLSRAL